METCTIALFLPVLFYASAIQGVLLFEGTAIREQDRTSHAELDQENAAWLMAAPSMPIVAAISNEMRRLSARHSVGGRFGPHRHYAYLHTRTWEPYLKMERSFIPDDALTIGYGLGQFYFLPDLKVLDYYGLTDATVARNPSTRANRERTIAHDRKPPPEYLKQRGANIRVFDPASSAAAALNVADYAANFGPDLWMPFDTVNAQWATDRFAGRDLRTFATQIEPLSVNYDGGIALQGFALG